MGDEDFLDKTILNISSDNATFQNATNFTFNIDLIEPLKDVCYIKILKSEVILNPSSVVDGVSRFEDTDPIYINMNDYKRISSVIDGNNIKYFDQILLNISEKFSNNVPNAFVSFSSQVTSTFNLYDPQMFILNPIEANLKKLNFELFNKNNKTFGKTDIKKFNIVLCVYQNRKKISRV